MRYDDLYVAGCGYWLPDTRSAEQAVAEGRLGARTARETQALAVAVAEGPTAPSGPEMAVSAAHSALAQAAEAGHDPAVDLLLHASVYYQGHDLWAPASYVQDRTVRGSAPAVEIRQLSNGGMAALELAAGYLSGAGGREAALLTAGDRFCAPGFDRWNGDPGTVYGDGGSALLLSRAGGFARLLSVVTHADSSLERMHRGDDPFGDRPFAVRQPIDMAVAKAAYTAEAGISLCVNRVSAGQHTALKTALAEAEVELADIDLFVLPHLGRRRLDAGFFKPFGIDPDRSTWSWSRSVGHLGAADQFAGLRMLHDTGRLRPGAHVLLAGIGAGFTWSCAVLRVADEGAAR